MTMTRITFDSMGAYPLQEGRCRMCRSKSIIVYQDFYQENSRSSYLQLCLACCKEYMIEEFNKIIVSIPEKIKRECKECGEVFLVNNNNSWASKCFECWKANKNFESKLKQAELDFEKKKEGEGNGTN